jgi:hypothetical protein
MDPFIITGVIASITALIIAILSHIKRSSCYGIKLVTKESHTPEIQTPDINTDNKEYQPLLLNHSEPITIPKKEIVKNYL